MPDAAFPIGQIEGANSRDMNQSWIRYLPSFIRQRLEGRHDLQKAIGNTGWLFAENIIRLGVNFFVGVWLARYLGPEQYGLFSYALAFVALFAPLGLLGLEDIVIRNIVRDPSSTDEIIGTSFALKLLGGVVAFCGTTGTIFLLRPANVMIHLLVMVMAAGTMFQAFSTIEQWFNSQLQSKYIFFAKCAPFTLCSCAKILLIIFNAPLLAFAWVGLFEVVSGSVGLVLTYKATGQVLGKWRLNLAKARELFKDSWPFMLSSLVMITYLRIDQVMIGSMLGDEEVGIYSVAVRLAEVWFFLSSVVYYSFFPGIVEAHAMSEDLFYERLQRLYNIMAFLGYLIALPMSFIATPLVIATFGAAYTQAGLVLAVLVWGNLFTSLELARNSFLTAMNWTRINLLTLSLGAMLNIVLNYFLIPRYGGMGAAISSCISYWFAAHGTCFMYKPLYKTGYMLTKAMLYPKVW
jgi:O-antigen/teichoic acid export membrane protein